uniref:Uncharacterized protein n=1 Tax=Anguilla anguilla TaxID=7936 RepID=A0A0E9WPS6_ANGAN
MECYTSRVSLCFKLRIFYFLKDVKWNWSFTSIWPQDVTVGTYGNGLPAYLKA